MGAVTNQTYAKTQYIDGKTRNIETDRYGKTFYVDDNGKRIYVDLKELKSGSAMEMAGLTGNLTETPQHFVDYYGKKYTEAREEMSFLKKVGSNLKEQYDKLHDDFTRYLSSLGVKEYKDIENEADRNYAKKTFCNNLTDLNHQRTSNSNQFFTTSMRAFDYALQQGNWLNQFNLAQHVEDNLRHS